MKNGSKPNILLVISDQLVAALTGAYGHPVVKTPNLNRLVSQGIRFESAYSNCPICAPARGALMSGQYVSNCKTYDNASPWPEDMVTIPHYLSLAGYDTVLSGKMHFIGADQLHGFHRRMVTNIYPADFKWTKPREEPPGMVTGEGIESRPTGKHARQYTGDAIHVGRWNSSLSYDEETHFRALEYLHAKGEEKNRRKDRRGPFFLCVSYHHPHEVFWPPQEYWDMYEGEPVDVPEHPDNLEDTYSIQDRWLNDHHGCGEYNLTDPESAAKVRRAYYALVTYIDHKVGELMASLEENGFSDNTVILFTSDHGDMLCEKGMVQKRTFYEWSARVPLILRLPDQKYSGMKIETPVSLVDIMPTFLDIAGVETRLPYDGRSLTGLLDGSDTSERIAFSEIHSEGIYVPCFMIRRGKFKYIYIHGRDEQLFDLKSDPGEWSNLADDLVYQELKQELKTLILKQFDPEAINVEVAASIKRRQLIRSTMSKTNTRWDVAPRFDATRDALSQYLV